MENKILYVARTGLPMDAAGVRIFYIGSILEKLGYSIHYVCDTRVNSATKKSDYERISPKSSEFLSYNEIHYAIDKKIYSYLPEFSGGKINAFKEIVELKNQNRLFKRIKGYCEKENPFAIFLYNELYPITKKLIRYCKKKGIKLFADITEWYEKDKNRSYSEKIVVKSTEKRIEKLDYKLDGIIAISSYLEDYYKEQGANVIRIPPLMEVDKDLKIKKYEYYKGKKVLNFVYAGSPGNKDILIPFVEAVKQINKDEIKVRFDVIGITKNYFTRHGDGTVATEEQGIIAHGRLPREQALEIVKNADFSILFRKPLRYAKAGFATKLAECMSNGVAMVCNKIGGSDTVIEDGVNGFLTKTYEVEEIVKFLEKLIAMDKKEILNIRTSAHEYAFSNFDVDKNIEKIEKLFVEKNESISSC